MKSCEYNDLLNKSVRNTYKKKTDVKKLKETNREATLITSKPELEKRMETMAMKWHI